MKSKLIPALLGTSLIFFFVFLMMLIQILRLFVFYQVILVSVGLVSIIGSLYSLNEIKNVSPLWYLGIPNIFALAFVCYAFVAESPANSQHYILFSISLAILSLSSTLFFISFPENQRKFTRYCAILSGIVAFYSVFGIYAVIGGNWYTVDSFLEIYIFYLMPVIGLLYIITAIWVFKNQ